MEKFTEYSKALYSYFNSIMPSFLEGNVPQGTQFPYLTYNLSYTPNYDDTLIQFSVWDKSTSLKTVASKLDLLGEDISNGKVVFTSNGSIQLYKGSPFGEMLQDEEPNIKRLYGVIQARIYL